MKAIKVKLTWQDNGSGKKEEEVYAVGMTVKDPKIGINITLKEIEVIE